MFNNRSKTAFIAALLGTVYSLYLLKYFGAGADETTGAVAFALVMPHFICNIIAAIFGWIGFKGNRKGMMIASLVFYILAIVTFILYFLFDLPMVIFAAIAISKISKINKQANE